MTTSNTWATELHHLYFPGPIKFNHLANPTMCPQILAPSPPITTLDLWVSLNSNMCTYTSHYLEHGHGLCSKLKKSNGISFKSGAPIGPSSIFSRFACWEFHPGVLSTEATECGLHGNHFIHICLHSHLLHPRGFIHNIHPKGQGLGNWPSINRPLMTPLTRVQVDHCLFFMLAFRALKL